MESHQEMFNVDQRHTFCPRLSHILSHYAKQQTNFVYHRSIVLKPIDESKGSTRTHFIGLYRSKGTNSNEELK